ncbi:MAG TPA: DUF4870 domain-containing protein [Marmoricola sp.]|nr:DUF4870 domain-containing protein [Marmoricola sp.]
MTTPHAHQQPYLQSPSQEERTWAWIAHAGCFVGAAVAMAFLVPLVIMLVKGGTSPFVRRHAVESLNFQISVLIYAAVSIVLALVLIGFFLLAALGVLYVVAVILGTVRAANGQEFRYPLTIRLVS